MKKLIVSASPHARSNETVTGIMLDVIIALVPSLICSIVVFGFRSLLITAVCVGCCVLFEYLSRKIMKRDNTIGDLSAIVTGMLLAFNLPVSIPLWMCVVGCFFAIVVVKQFFGGIGKNFVNPAIGGRIVMLVSFSSSMTSWTEPMSWFNGVDAVSTATPLSILKDYAGEISSDLPSLWHMFLGIRAGSLGEVSAVAILIGGLYLLARRVIKPTIPLCFIGTVAVITLIAGKGDFTYMAYQLLSGGLLLGAFFMATDYATSPITNWGKVIFGIGCGAVTCLIRLCANLPEGVSYSIIIMNILVPHIESFTRPKPFGTVKEKKTKEEKAS